VLIRARHWFLCWVKYNLSVFFTVNEWPAGWPFHVIPLEVNQHKNLIWFHLARVTILFVTPNLYFRTSFMFAVVATTVCMQFYFPSATEPSGLLQFIVQLVAIYCCYLLAFGVRLYSVKYSCHFFLLVSVCVLTLLPILHCSYNYFYHCHRLRHHLLS